LKYGTQARANWRALISAALLGSSVGLGLGVTLLSAGLASHVADHADDVRMAQAAAAGSGSYLDTQGAGLHTGLERYGLRTGVDAKIVAARFAVDRGGFKAKRRADLECLTDAVYYEARGEDVRGQAAVAQVVLNRVKHPAFPKSVCGVVFQGSSHRGCQFSFTCDGSMRRHRESAAWNRARVVASRVLAGNITRYVGSATHYHTTAVSPFWAPQMARVAQVGVHVFYKFSPYKLRALPSGEPAMEQAVLISLPAAQAHEVRVSPSVEKAIEASLQPAATDASATAGAKAPAAKPAEAAMLTAPQQVSAAAS